MLNMDIKNKSRVNNTSKMIATTIILLCLSFFIPKRTLGQVDINLAYIIRYIASFIILFFSMKLDIVKTSIAKVVVTVLLTAIMVLGRIYSSKGTLFGESNTQIVIDIILSSMSLGVFCLCVVNVLYLFFDYVSFEKTTYRVITEKKNNYIVVMLATFAVYCMCLIILRPNIATYDSYNQIAQAMGWIPLANNNPVFHTLIIRGIFNLGMLFTKNQLVLVTLYEITSILLFSFVTTLAIILIDKSYKKNSTVKIILILFYFLNPIIGWYCVTLWKDIWISYAVLALVIIVNENCEKDYSFRNFIEIYISTLFVLICKGTGIIIIAFFAFGIIATRMINLEKKKIIIPITVAIATSLLATNIAIEKYNVEEHSLSEAESIIWQTTARTVCENKGRLSKTEKKFISSYLDIEKAVGLYDSRISDPIKGTCLTADTFNDELFTNIKKWIKLGLHYPKSYIDAVFSGTYGYYYPEIRHWVFPVHNYVTITDLYRNNEYCIKFDPNIDNYDLIYAYSRYESNSFKARILEKIRAVPIAGLFGSIGAYFFVYVVLLFYTIENRNKQFRRYYLLVPIAVFCTCFISPVFAEMRYAYPAIVSLPIIISTVIIPEEKEL